MSKFLSLFLILKLIFIFKKSVQSPSQRFIKDQDILQSLENFTCESQNNQILNVHLIPHTHDDVGWLKKVDEYYYGARGDIQKAGVQYILDTVIQQLLLDPSKKFVYVEIGFFLRWWREQSAKMRQKVKFLVKNKQLEFINGGYCMNDEAAAYYEDIIDQMTIGHQFLLNTFGITPTIGWHIDPFGHQASQASLFNQMGFNAFFFARIDYQDKKKRLKDKAMEMIWAPYQTSGLDHSIFTIVNYYHYEAPPQFCFDVNCDDEPISDDPLLENYNIQRKSEQFVRYFKCMAQYYRSNELMHTMGSDFQYRNALQNYKNMDKLINYINQNFQDIKFFYSTPENYINQIYQKNISFPIKYDDFMPYADQIDAYWTGYFTSRVALKLFIKESGRFLQKIRTLFGLFSMNKDSSFEKKKSFYMKAINSLEEAMAINQHHDAITGTAKQRVTFDYLEYLSKGIQMSQEAFSEILQTKTQEIIGENCSYYFCNWNETAQQCQTVIENIVYLRKTQTIIVYNPTITTKVLLQFKVPNINVKVLNQLNQEIESDLVCQDDDNIHNCDLYIYSEILQFQFNYFKLIPNQEELFIKKKPEVIPRNTQKVKKFKHFSISPDFQTFKFTNRNQKDLDLKIQYKMYLSECSASSQSSGAYIFRPNEQTKYGSIPYVDYSHMTVFEGKLLSIITLHSKEITAQIKYYHVDYLMSQDGVEIETFVNSINTDDNQGKEITLNIQTNLNNNNTFYTDSNGLELQKRVINFRPTWDLQVNQPVSGNYYPVNGMIKIEDINTKEQFYIFNDRAQGGSSYRNGEVEIMIHRRMLCDDGRGVGEALDESMPNGKGLTARMKHYLLFSDQQDDQVHRRIQFYLDLAPVISFGGQCNQAKFVQMKQQIFNTKFEIKEFLKFYIQELNPNQFLIRYHNMNERKSIETNLSNEYKEVTLTANQLKQDMLDKKFKWKSEQEIKRNSDKITRNHQSDRLQILPMELKAFLEEKKSRIRNFIQEIFQKIK